MRDGIPMVLTAMQTHCDNPTLQQVACGALLNFVCNSIERKDYVVQVGANPVVVQCIIVHANQGPVQRWACMSLSSLCSVHVDEHAQVVLEAGGFRPIATALDAFGNTDRELYEHASKLLVSLLLQFPRHSVQEQEQEVEEEVAGSEAEEEEDAEYDL